MMVVVGGTGQQAASRRSESHFDQWHLIQLQTGLSAWGQERQCVESPRTAQNAVERVIPFAHLSTTALSPERQHPG